MSPGSAVALAALLFALFLLIVGLMVWQEAKRRPGSAERAYVIDDAVRFINPRLDDGPRERLGVAGVRRVIEWEVHYLQGLAQETRRHPVETVAGGSDASIDYIVGQIAEVNGVTYDREDVADVLRLEADYLVSIGAVGEPVDPDSDQEQSSDQGGEEA
jgi:hypothetical protein